MYSLPTEAQWEYACRAGSTTKYCYGDGEAELGDYAWFYENSGNSTHPVGSKKPNRWGLYDMHGNAWEWCDDGYGPYQAGTVSDPGGPPAGSDRVVRGGSRGDIGRHCRSTNRISRNPGERFVYIGFRVVLVRSDASSDTPPTKTVEKPSPQPALAVGSLDAAEAKQVQQRCASSLGASVVLTNSIEMKLVLIPPGEFDMGSTPEDVVQLLAEGKRQNAPGWYLERVPAEAPKHHVKISKPFYLGVCEVTQAEYGRVMGKDPSKFKGDLNRPVEQVNWDEAVEFCRRLSASPKERAVGAVYRLPTEAEWEFTCRAGTTTRYGFGDDATGLGQHAWWKGNSQRQTHPVGQLRPNAWGLYDMHGNVWEWCADRSDDNSYRQSKSEAALDPQGAGTGPLRVHRGGGWMDDGSCFRSAFGRVVDPGGRGTDWGFRVARTLTP